jgi:hypothetical protein
MFQPGSVLPKQVRSLFDGLWSMACCLSDGADLCL